METRTLLLELHCEEIPARFLRPLAEEMAEALASWADGERLGRPAVRLLFSPCKLAWIASGLPVGQADKAEVLVGPPQRLCVDQAGKPTQTGLKFAEKCGVDFSVLRFELPAGRKEACAVAALTRRGRPSADLLSEALPRLIAGLRVPKAMRWGNSGFEFVRPIRSLLCLFGGEVVPFTVDGVKSSNATWGHRLYHRKHPDPVRVGSPDGYEAALQEAGVVASFDERRRLLSEQLERLAAEAGGRPVRDEDLLSTLALIVEFPRLVRGAFPADFLNLPKEVLVTSLKEHQKSFCVEDAKGRLLPCFLAAANRPDDPAGFVVSGNEWVLKARLYDARFFFAEDGKTRLSDRVEKLSTLTFQRDLGSYLEKTRRIERIVDAAAPRLGLDAGQACAAASVAKADLMTLMVGEFPELQGVMGGEYLLREGVPEAVWMAVKEHYRPVSADGPLPSTPLGRLLAMADKLDTVVGCFSVGLIPSGSKDPLALRRAGAGIVRILWESGWSLDPMELCRIALEAVGAKARAPGVDTLGALESFFRDRVAYQLESAGYAGPVRRAALPAGWKDLPDLKARCGALAAFAEDARFASLAQGAKRIGNILKDEAPSPEFDAKALAQAEEKVLASRLAVLEGATDHAAMLAALADLAEPLEAFFNAVMVKCEDPRLRAARLSLLFRLRRTFLRMADFSLWQ